MPFILELTDVVSVEADVSKEILESPKKKSKKEAEVKDVSINLKVKSIHKPKR